MADRGKVFVITGPSGVGKGTLIQNLLEAVPELDLSISATTREPRPGEADGRDYHFLSDEEFARRAGAGDFLEHADYSGNRYGTLRDEVERRLNSGRSVVLEIEVQGARQVREAMPEAIQIFIAPPDPAALRDRLLRRGTDSPEAIERRLRTAESELASQSEFPHVVVNDDVQEAAEDLARLVRGALPRLVFLMIKPRVDKLLDQTDSHYAAVVIAAKRARQINAYYHSLSEGAYGEYTPPMVDVPSGNYLTIALEETAAGKLKFEYKA